MNERKFLERCRNAWYLVYYELNEIDPDWQRYGDTPEEAVSNFIKDLARRAKANEEKTQPVHAAMDYQLLDKSDSEKLRKGLMDLAMNPPIMGVYPVNDTTKTSKPRVPDVASIQLLQELIRETMDISNEITRMNPRGVKALLNVQNKLIDLLLELKSD